MGTEEYSILLAEDNPGDIRLVQEVFKHSKIVKHLHVVQDGAEALAFLHNEGKYEGVEKPDIVLLDINLPKRNGLEVLQELKQDEALRHIPIIMLSSSESMHDITESYEFQANCFISKPVNFDEFFELMNMIETFWLEAALLPQH